MWVRNDDGIKATFALDLGPIRGILWRTLREWTYKVHCRTIEAGHHVPEHIAFAGYKKNRALADGKLEKT